MRRTIPTAILAGGLLTVLFAAIPALADRIVLRNLTVISDKTVASFDEDGIRFAEGGGVAWDEVERGTVAADKQAAFDTMLKDLGEHLYRIRQRLGVEDYQGLLAHAEAVYPRYRQRQSETAYLVCQAVMWGRLAQRRREEALEPYLHCYELLRAAQGKPLKLPGERTLQVDLETGLSPELLPVWFDSQAAAKVLDEVFQTISKMNKPLPDGARVYYATLALAAGDDAKAMSVLRGFAPASPAVEQLREIALAQREVAAGQSAAAVANVESKLNQLSPIAKPVALYWIGRAKIIAADERTRQEGMLQLLRIAAVYGEQHPELAAAGLFHTMEGLAATSGAAQSAAVRKELLDRYGQTYYAARAKEQPAEKK
jgi:hypothetical protein